MEFLYINANEGTASGGHVAIRFDREVFHFQHVPSGLLRITRDDFRHFRTLYGMAENRTLFGHRIDVSEETWNLLRDGFNRRLLIQDEQFEQWESLGRDIRLLRQLAEDRPPPMVDVKGLGLFMPAGREPMPEDGSLKRLRESIEKRHGTGFLQALAHRLRGEIASLQANDALPEPAAIEADRFVPARYGYAERYMDRLTALAALDVLQGGFRVRPDALLPPHGAGFILDEKTLQHLQTFASRLQDSLASLPSRPHANWGYALLLGMARLAAADTSLRDGRLTVLDLRTALPSPPPFKDSEMMGTLQADFLKQAEEGYRRAHAAFRTGEADEKLYARLERSANLLNYARTSGSSAALQFTPLPARPAGARLIAPGMSRAHLAGQRARLEIAERDMGERLAQLYPYDLVTGNCVSELFRTVDRILVEHPATDEDWENEVRKASTRRLGGHVRPGFPNFIPFTAFRAVGANWRVSQTRELPSWRHLQLRKSRQELGIWADLRESNVLTAGLYRWHEGDAAFLFFSDTQPWLGLLTGPVNAAVGLGQGVAGLATLPWDGGHHLRQGFKGFLISLPEMFFFNIRKGSYPVFSGAGINPPPEE